MALVDRIPGSAPASPGRGDQPADEARTEEGRAVSGAAALAPRSATGAIAPAGARSRRSADDAVAFDPVAELEEIAAAGGITRAARPGLATQLLDYVAPRPRSFDSLAPSRLLPLLGLAADQVGRAGQESDEIGKLGASALEQELEQHRALAERRATMIER
jgi:hypothetical protein